jgi:NAD(P)-dependent dehydrogenase (short-subunit alcohol dehydrogenase family)
VDPDSDARKPVALVVGAGDYIGAAIARRFAREGYVACLGRRRGDQAKPLADEIVAAGGEAHAFGLDAREESQVVELVDRIEREIGPLEVVVFNVGANVNFPIRETTTRVFTKVWQMACLAGFLTGREAARVMAPRRKGTILFTGATASLRGGAGYAAFASAKSGLRALAQSMARELGPENLHVAHVVIDAGVDTAWVRERIEQSTGRRVDQLPEDTLVDPDSIAELYWFLHRQPRDAWSFEVDLRPAIEKW